MAGGKIFQTKTVDPTDPSIGGKIYQVVQVDPTDPHTQGMVYQVVNVGGGSATIEELNVTPSTSAQTIAATSSVDGYAPVNVAAVDASIDANIVAGNIKNGVEILGVTGSVIELNGETKTITPQVYGQTLYPTAPKNGITEITVNAVTSSIDANIQAGNIKKDVTILGVTGTFEGGTTGKYQLLQRVKDDTNTEIGTVVGFRKDSSNNEYAVVCLDARYRSDQWFSLLSSGVDYGNASYQYANVFAAKETATENCDAIVAVATGGITCDAVTQCRLNSFTVDSVTYYGQLPSMPELIDIMSYVDEINNADPDKDNPTYEYYLLAGGGAYWSSTQNGTSTSWQISSNATQPVRALSKTGVTAGITPILELPNA